MLLNYKQVLETARQVASVPVSSTPIPYDQVTNQCEALVTGKQQKMSVLHSFKLRQEGKAIVLSHENERTLPNLVRISSFHLVLPAFFLFFLVRIRTLDLHYNPFRLREKRKDYSFSPTHLDIVFWCEIYRLQRSIEMISF